MLDVDILGTIDKIVTENNNRNITACVGTITKINTDPISVNVRKNIHIRTKQTSFIEAQELIKVPIMQLFGKSFKVKLPFNVGDTGILIWFHREVYSWLSHASEETAKPDSGEMQNLQSCVFMPFIQKFNKQNQIHDDGVDIVSGDISLLSQLIQLLSKLIEDFSQKFVTLAPLPIQNGSADVSQLIAIGTQLTVELQSIQSNFIQFKGQQ